MPRLEAPARSNPHRPRRHPGWRHYSKRHDVIHSQGFEMAALEHNEQKLKLLRSKYDKLSAIAEAARTLEQTDALIELADDMAALESKVEKQRKKASVTQEEA